MRLTIAGPSEDMTGDQSGDCANQIVNLPKALTTKGQFVRLSPHTVLATMETINASLFVVFCIRTHQKQTFVHEDARARRKERPSPQAIDGRKVGARRHHRCM